MCSISPGRPDDTPVVTVDGVEYYPDAISLLSHRHPARVLAAQQYPDVWGNGPELGTAEPKRSDDDAPATRRSIRWLHGRHRLLADQVADIRRDVAELAAAVASLECRP